MPFHRRLTAALAAASLGWAGLTLGVVAPAATAAEPAATTVVASAPASATATAVPRAPKAAPHDPVTYYAGTEGLSGATLAAKLHTIVKAGALTRTYAQVYTDLPVTDPDPARPGYLIDFYSGTSILASDRCSSSCPVGSWNREHTWPQSHGDFGTSAGIGTDLFHMRPEFGNTNSSRGNLDFDNTTNPAGYTVPNCADCRRDADSFEPRAAVKGDLARGLLFMAVRYEGDDSLNLKMNDRTCNGSGTPNMGKLSTLVAWSLADPPDDRERARNDLIDGDYQHNRNPFIDHPEWVTSIFGNGVGLGPACGSTSGDDYVPGGTGGVNTAPTSSPTTTTTAEDTTVTAALTGSDADGDPLTWSVRQAPVNGTASVSGSTLTYNPAANFNGTDQVGVRVSDGRGGTSDTTVTITVTPVNDAPTASAVTVSAPSGASTAVALVGADVDDTVLTYAIASQPAHGTVSVSGATATYTPTAGYAGADSFTYTVRDPANATSAPATVSITVTAAAEQHAPVATAGSATTPEDQAVTLTLLANDPDGDPLSYSIAGQPAHGSVKLADDKATYTPQPDYHGPDAFTFTASDPSTISAPATVSLTVTPVNDAPVANPVGATTPQSVPTTVTLSGSDVDGDALTYAIATQPAHGTVTSSGTQVTYTPASTYSGPDSFTWTVSDGTVTTTGTASLTVLPNHRPTAGALSATTTEDGGVTIPLTGSDTDGDPLTYALGDPPAHGTVEVAGATATYTPAPGFSGTDTFTYTASDRISTSDPATVSVTVTPVDDPLQTAQLRLATPAATRGTRVTTTITATGPTGPAPTGTVTLKTGSTTLGTAPLRADGTATVSWIPKRAGTTSLVASYAGDSLFAPATSTAVARTVARSAARLTFAAGALKRGRAGVVKVSVRTVAGVAATGKVTLTVGGKKLTARLTKGVATLRIAKLPKTARLKVSARYAGDTQYAVASARHTFRLKA